MKGHSQKNKTKNHHRWFFKNFIRIKAMGDLKRQVLLEICGKYVTQPKQASDNGGGQNWS